ncbi:I78 family peptidase inhibitor [Amaricoccus sp.]|uniref:I78 family peptidase inhibitor n=1 Tax=Amaricoccus sp. TaxID=1872485 RepID=UPI002601DB32|nr:I78 family peptidase inhibitor [Amaricoccus sp.]HRO11879.1 I78 family peptidase inhibitor [Amaricoccus sp.]
MPSPLQTGLGIALLLALGACAELNVGVPGEAAAEGGTCGAEAHQDWVGQRVDVLNDVDLPEGARVLFPTTPATMDYRAERLNVSVDKADTITRVYCG